MERRKFSREFKIEAVRLIRERGVSVAQAARDHDLHENMLRRWVKEMAGDPAQAFPGNGQMKPEQMEIDRLRREVAKLRAERDIPKKGRSLLCEGSEMRFAFIAKHRSIWPVAWLCEALDVSRSGFHAWLKRGPSVREQIDEEMTASIRASFVASGRTYGARRVWRDVLSDGFSCGLHKIERLMRANALRARPRRRGLPKDGGQRLANAVAPNVLDRQFVAERPNRKWIADFTYIWTAEGWLYVAAVIDLFSRRVVGWSMKAEMTAQLVADALIMAIWRRRLEPSQYTSDQFQRLMTDNGVTCSMSRSGNVWDNAAMESFFSSLKTERIGRKVYRTRDAAGAVVFDYIDRFYNTARRHSTIGYLSPVEFERKVGLA
ncbi:IS3 family transposase [Rhodoblastus acidophilus]|uniref:IS3 family transposase n=1 Tax=Candidatus Rhodoblastus alkanivorans TaxID=2954117 RepID=A0ABS9Z2B8_9HYPH|nr:IS3 family transposase [Candidatus Rhodoblastus alkanivorans]MCI4677432.1 IS3 family transposase [Candidatus Rhodoblastus alkanivorans]MCI4681791.1 IS3 family transposase [Candidatus Rhodoblastus alkanivorans]MDI4642841.1 IS3 family transposase [Rhodoblastus acidophilus]